jgi:hypothetical protein
MLEYIRSEDLNKREYQNEINRKIESNRAKKKEIVKSYNDFVQKNRNKVETQKENVKSININDSEVEITSSKSKTCLIL